ncbi:MAG: DUF5995 family protein [Ferruginibacter sp.]
MSSSISEVIIRLTEIVDKTIAENNRAGYFAALYRKVTMMIAEKIKAGYFDDNIRMEKLDVVFANRYLDAWDCNNAGSPCSSSWQLAFDTCKNWQPMVMHHLLCGMNAHISLDLGIAAAVVCPGDQIETIHNDFNKINALLSDLVAGVKADLYSMWPLSKLISKLHTDKLENDIAGFSMNIARDAAWQVALAYAACTNGDAQQNYITERDKAVTAFGNQLLQPGKFIQAVTAVFRVFEFGTVAGKVKRLGNKKY